MRKALSVLAALALTLSTGVASAHDGHAHGKEAILGTVAQVHGDHLEVADPDGKTVSVTLTSATTYLSGDSEAKKADIFIAASRAICFFRIARGACDRSSWW